MRLLFPFARLILGCASEEVVLDMTAPPFYIMSRLAPDLRYQVEVASIGHYCAHEAPACPSLTVKHQRSKVG